MKHENHTVTRAQFEENLHRKSQDPLFNTDIQNLLRTESAEWKLEEALKVVLENFISLLPGEPWKG